MSGPGGNGNDGRDGVDDRVNDDESTRRLDDLWTRFLARHQLSAGERDQLVVAIEGDELFRRRIVNDLQMDGAMRALGDIERGQDKIVAKIRALVTAAGRTEEVVAAVRKRIEAKAAVRASTGRMTPVPRRRSGAVITAGVLLAAAAAVVVLRPRGDSDRGGPRAQQNDRGGQGSVTSRLRDRWEHARRAAVPDPRSDTTAPALGHGRVVVARIAAFEGAVYRHGADGTLRVAGEIDIGVGDMVSTSGPATRARLSGPGGSQIDLTGDAVASFAAEAREGTATTATTRPGAVVRLFVAHGRIAAAIPAGATGPTLTLASPHATIRGAGTFHLNVGTSVTRVEVKEGRARISALGVQRGTDVESGQMALVSGDDLQPRAQAVREALLLTGPDDTKEDVPGGGALRGSEERLKARLERVGFEVSVVEAEALTQERARAASLLVLSSSVASNRLQPWIGELPVGLVVLESTGFEQLGLTGARWLRDVGNTPALTEVTIENAGHPLAGGLSGTVKVFNGPMRMRWGAPLPGATSIVTYAGAADPAALLFGYERGAATISGPAPARRVGMFLGNGRVIRALNEQGWRLFDAAVIWAAGS
jgi:hypothetical protein